MTLHAFAETLDRISAKLKTLPDGPNPFSLGNEPAIADEDMIIGAAFLWMYLRDLLTTGPKEHYSRGELLVVLDIISRDTELWPAAHMLKQIADAMCAEDDEEGDGNV